MANKRIPPNRYKPKAKPGKPFFVRIQELKTGRFSKVFFAFCFVLIMSMSAILFHDAVVQSPFLTVGHVTVSGLNRISKAQIIEAAGLHPEKNPLNLKPGRIEKKLETLPWVADAQVSFNPFSGFSITIEEETPLAIATIEGMVDLVVNTQGVPFKKYDPENDALEHLPVISGLHLTSSSSGYRFEGKLFNSVMALLKIKNLNRIGTIHGDPVTGIHIRVPDVYNKKMGEENEGENGAAMPIPIKLGFDRFEEKLKKAMDISGYMAALFPDKTILAMDLYDIEQIFIKTEDALHNTLKKGV